MASDYTPEQLQRRREARDRWRAKNPREWRFRRGRGRVSGSESGKVSGSESGSAAADRQLAEPTGLPAPFVAFLSELESKLAALAALDARVGEVLGAAARRDPAPRSGRITAGSLENAGSPVAATRSGPPLARFVNTPPELRDNPGSAYAAAVAAGGVGGQQQQQHGAPPGVDPWSSDAALSVARARNLSDADLVYQRAQFEQRYGSAATLDGVLRWLRMSLPAPIAEAPAVATTTAAATSATSSWSGRRGFAPEPEPLQWILDAEAACKRDIVTRRQELIAGGHLPADFGAELAGAAF